MVWLKVDAQKAFTVFFPSCNNIIETIKILPSVRSLLRLVIHGIWTILFSSHPPLLDITSKWQSSYWNSGPLVPNPLIPPSIILWQFRSLGSIISCDLILFLTSIFRWEYFLAYTGVRELTPLSKLYSIYEAAPRLEIYFCCVEISFCIIFIHWS